MRACARQQIRLSWLPAQIKTLQQSFDENWRPHFRTLLRGYKPYSDVWDYAAANRLLGPEFVNLYAASETMPTKVGQERKKRLVESATRTTEGWTLAKRYEQPLAAIDGLKQDLWPFKVVYQRALFRAFVNVPRWPGSYFPGGVDRVEATESFVACMAATGPPHRRSRGVQRRAGQGRALPPADRPGHGRDRAV